MTKQFPDVGSQYGAPMGRPSYGILENCDPESVELFRVRMVDGCYDDGGAYWGMPANLFCARSDDGGYQQFVRAASRAEAIELLEIGPDYFHVLKKS